MKQFHLRFDIPNVIPFDKNDWQIQAQGEIVAPFITSHRPTRFWFSHYGGWENGRHLLVRYESETQADTSNLSLQPSEHHEFDIHNDLGHSRFLDPHQEKSNGIDRGSKIFDFLHAAAILTLDQLSHQKNGYWVREESPDKGNNHFGSPLESIHHLFCNLSQVRTGVVLVPPNKPSQILSPLYAKINRVYQVGMRVIPVHY